MTAYTEEDAKGLWCPFSRVAITAPPEKPLKPDQMQHITTPFKQASFNRADIPGHPRPAFPVAASCVGSRCMLWQWQGMPQTPETPRTGFCGLGRAS